MNLTLSGITIESSYEFVELPLDRPFDPQVNEYTVQVPAEIIDNDEPVNVMFDKTDYDTYWGYDDAQLNRECRAPANVYYLLPGQRELPDTYLTWTPTEESALHDNSFMTQVYFTNHADADRAVVTIGIFNGQATKVTKITFRRANA